MNRYKEALFRMGSILEPISKNYCKSKFYFWLNALWCNIRYGVTPNEYIGFEFYRLSGLERSRFYTARMEKKYETKLNDTAFFLTFWDKGKFNAEFCGWVKRDWIFTGDADSQKISDFLKRHPKVIIKPTSLSSGRGIYIYTDESIEDLKKDKCLLEEYIVQHNQMAKLNVSSVNSVRIYTILDEQSIPHILSSSIRVGAAGRPVDNFHSGGVGYPVDCDTGIVFAAGTNLLGKKYLYNPCGTVKVIGFQVPNWAALKAFVFSACLHIPTARFIAWDVAVLQNGFEMIEANYNGDPGFMQAPSKQGKLNNIRNWSR